MKKGCLIVAAIFAVMVLISALVALLGMTDKMPLSVGKKVALVRVEGPILDARQTIKDIKKYAADSSVKAIVLRVDSPGGAVAPSQEIYEEVKKAAKQKYVVASMGSIAASGGYYISAAATKIYANPGTLTGSIGVIMEIPNVQGLMDKIGIKTQIIKSGRHKDMASAFREMDEEDRLILQGVIDDVHVQFMEAVAEGRNLDMQKVRELSDGRIFTGKQALSLGLVDELGNIEDAIDGAAKLAGIKGKPVVISRKEKLSVFDYFKNRFSGGLAEFFPSVKIQYLYVP